MAVLGLPPTITRSISEDPYSFRFSFLDPKRHYLLSLVETSHNDIRLPAIVAYFGLFFLDMTKIPIEEYAGSHSLSASFGDIMNPWSLPTQTEAPEDIVVMFSQAKTLSYKAIYASHPGRMFTAMKHRVQRFR